MENKDKILVILIHNSYKIHQKPSTWFEKIIDKYQGHKYRRIIRLLDNEINYESDFYNYARNDEYVICEEYL